MICHDSDFPNCRDQAGDRPFEWSRVCACAAARSSINRYAVAEPPVADAMLKEGIIDVLVILNALRAGWPAAIVGVAPLRPDSMLS